MLAGLISNFAVAGLFVAVWLFALEGTAKWSRRKKQVGIGLLLGVGAIATIATSVKTPEGVFFDLRFALLAATALLEGPVAGLIAGLVAIAFRWFEGGVGWLPGSAAVVIAVTIGVTANRCMRDCAIWSRPLASILIVSVAASVLPNAVALLLPAEMLDLAFGKALLLEAALNFLGLICIILGVRHRKLRLNERALLLAAIDQVPDYFYVKDRQSRFVAVNHNVAQHHGQPSNASLVGKTDIDIETERGQQLFVAEQALMQQPGSTFGNRETLELKPGQTRIFDTTKVSVSDVNGEVIGLVGITRDVTDAYEAEKTIQEEQHLLFSVLSKMVDGVALFDEDARFVFCNEQYHDFFSRTRDVRVPGAPLRSILTVAAERGEQTDIPANEIESWIERVTSGMKRGQDEEVRLADGRTVRIQTKVVSGLGSVSVVSDITDMRGNEQQLTALAAEMEKLASTDALTGVINRRALDRELEREVARARRSRMPLSLIILDVDHFKAFNDLYGHPEGDACLQAVTGILQAQLKRASDLLGRYGGEEFCVLLPDTDENGASVMAEQLRTAVANARIRHEACDAGIVTASLGVATLPAGSDGVSASELLKMADTALYGAKKAGRNRVRQHSRLLDTITGDKPANRNQTRRKIPSA